MLSSIINYSPLSYLFGLFGNNTFINIPKAIDFNDKIKLIFIKDEGVIHNNKSKEITLAYNSLSKLINDGNRDENGNDIKICLLSNNIVLIPSGIKEKYANYKIPVYNKNFNIMTTAGLVCYKLNEIVLNRFKEDKKQVRIGFIGDKKLFTILKESLNDKNKDKSLIYRITTNKYIPKNIDYILLGCIDKNNNTLNEAIIELIDYNKDVKFLFYNETNNNDNADNDKKIEDNKLSYKDIINKFNINENDINEMISIYNYNSYFDKMKKYYNNNDNDSIMIISNNYDELIKFNKEGYKTCLTLTDGNTYNIVQDKINNDGNNKLYDKINYIIPDLSFINLY